MLKDRYISPFETALGKIKGDEQVKGTYCHYGDIAMETLLQVLKPELEKKIKLKLVPTYSYQRIYKKGDILKRHIDRNSCEISATLNLLDNDTRTSYSGILKGSILKSNYKLDRYKISTLYLI